MSSADRALAYRVFSDALDIAPGERDAFLDERLRGEPALKATVERLLAIAHAEQAATGLLFANVTAMPVDCSGRQYGPFRLIERLGVGGMGSVYRAERTDGVSQIVAIKVLRDGLTRASSGEFLREARILAQLEHPSIARLIDAGVDHGEGWIAMEYVRGKPITDYCRGLGLTERIGLLISVADAIASAHRMLIVHRDIKPTNVLVTDDGVPKLIDFGIASALDAAGGTREPTADVRRLFTAHYAAPEQVRGEAVTVATDVFGMGALAYRLLTGRELFAEAASPVAYVLAVTQRDVPLPSRVAATDAEEQAWPRRLRGDLDCILLKALAREPRERYDGVPELREDLRAYLDRRPVRAHRPTWVYRCAKFTRRHAIGLGVATAFATALVAAAGIYIAQEQRITQAQAAAGRRGEFLESLLKSADPYGGQRDITVASLLDKASRQMDRQFSAEPLTEASMLEVIARTNMGLGRFREGHAANDRQLEILQRHGVQGLELGRALILRGELYRFESQWGPSAVALGAAVGELQRATSPIDLSVALDNLGVAQMQLQQLDAAEATFRRELAIEERSGLRAQRMQADYSISALLGAELGRYEEAEGYAAEAWHLAQQLLPPDDPDWLEMEDGYAVALRNIHRPREAEPIFRDALARSSRVLGPEHHDTLVTTLGLGNDLIDLHRDAEAAQLALATARTLDATLGSDNWYALYAWQQYGLASCNSDRALDGLAALQRVAAARRRILPAGHRLIYSTDVDIGSCLMRLRRLEAAEPVLMGAAAGLTKCRGARYPRTQEAYAALRDLYAALNRPNESAFWAAKLRGHPTRQVVRSSPSL
jgi:eukaryotic-like serine/threonine-protein kinase